MALRKAKTVVLVLSGMFAIHIAVGITNWPHIASGDPDFTIFYSAAQLVRQGHGDKLYDEAAEWQVQRGVAPAIHRSAAVPYMHAPFEVLLFVPLTLLPLTSAYVAWNLFNLFLLLCFACVLKSLLPALQHHSLLLLGLLPLGFFPVFNTLLQGQDLIFLLLLYTFVFAMLRKGAWLQAGCWLGLGSFRMHLVAPFLIFMLLLRRWRFLIGFLATTAGLAVVSALIVGWHELLRYPAYIWNLEHRLGPLILPARDSPNLRGLAEGLLLPWLSARSMSVTVGLVSITTILGILRYCGRQGPDPATFDLQFSLILVGTVLLSYHTLFYDYSLLLLSMFVVWNYMLSNPQIRQRRLLSLLVPAALLWFTPLYIWLWFHRWEGSNWVALIPMVWAAALISEISRITLAELPQPC